MRLPKNYVLHVHPSTLEVYARAFGWKLKRGKVPRGSHWVCRVCSARAHVGPCKRRTLARIRPLFS